MGLEEVVKDITNRADKEAKAIAAEGKKEAGEITDAAKARAKRIQEDAHRQAETAAAAIERREIATQKLHNKKALLDAKKAILDEVFGNARDAIATMSQRERAEVFKQLLEKSKVLKDRKYYYCRAEDKALLAELAPGLEYGGEIECLGSFTVESADRARIENYTFDIILDNAQDSVLPEVSKQLFGELDES